MAEGCDDPFDSIVFIEDKIYSEGFEAGFSQGIKRGQLEGYETGCKKGMQIGEEIGFYLGFTETWLLVAKDEDGLTEKLKRLMNGFSEALLSFDILNIHRDNYFSQIQQMRSKYKQITSLLKISTEYQDKSSLNY